MKISIITPSYNQVEFLERTILSVLNQKYGNLEFIVIDGGSQDGSVDILEKYSGRVNWISEPDTGQSNAINKGLKMATGEIVAFLNSDDTYNCNSLSDVYEFFSKNNETMWAYGKCRIINNRDQEIRKIITLYKNLLLKKYSYTKLLTENFISQPSTFWRRKVHDEIGFLNEDEHFCMDYEFWLRLGKKYQPGLINQYLANFRYHQSSKSGQVNRYQFKDQLRLARVFCAGNRIPILIHQFNYFKIVWTYKMISLFENKQ